jgi:hypothetical protein
MWIDLRCFAGFSDLANHGHRLDPLRAISNSRLQFSLRHSLPKRNYFGRQPVEFIGSLVLSHSRQGSPKARSRDRSRRVRTWRASITVIVTFDYKKYEYHGVQFQSLKSAPLSF